MSDHQTMIILPGSTRKAVPNARLLGKSDPTKKIRVSVYVRRNPNPPPEAATAAKTLLEQPPGARVALTEEQFNSVYGADPADLDRASAWAEQNKLKVVDRSIPKHRLLVEGTIGDIQTAFGVELKEYDHPRNGPFRGREGVIKVSSDVAGVITGVFGLDTRKVGIPRRRKIPGREADLHTFKAHGKDAHAHKASPPLSNQWPGTFFPPQVAHLYNYPTEADGAGQNVAIFAFNGPPTPNPHGGYKLASLKIYFEQVLGGKTPVIQDVVVMGPGNDPGPDSQASDQQGDATGEVMLDMCVVGSVAPGAKIFMYFTEFNSQGWTEALSEVTTDNNNISVLSISYGNPEDDPEGAWTAMAVTQVNNSFEAAAAKQITVSCAAGDDGSSDQVSTGAHVDFPASSPWVLGVGGTKLTATSGASPTIASEVVWNETQLGDGATGGGVSAVFSKPTYQSGVNVPPSANAGHVVGRGVPDVAAVADPLTGVVVIHVSGKKLEPIGGTSASAPLWASLIARLNQALNTPCGFINPTLYTKFASGVLNDITSGNNGAYSAAPGWDACTGLGSPQGERLLDALTTSQKKPVPVKT